MELYSNKVMLCGIEKTWQHICNIRTTDKGSSQTVQSVWSLSYKMCMPRNAKNGHSYLAGDLPFIFFSFFTNWIYITSAIRGTRDGTGSSVRLLRLRWQLCHVSSATLGKLLPLSEPQLPHLLVGLVSVPTRLGCCDHRILQCTHSTEYSIWK